MSLASRLTSQWQNEERSRSALPDCVDAFSTREFVDLAYQVVIGRKAEPEAVSYHSDRIDGGEKTRGYLVYELTQSPEFRTFHSDFARLSERDFVGLAYQIVLGRKATDDEVARNSELLRQGWSSRHHIVYTLYMSEEYRNSTWDGMSFWLVLHRARFLVASQLPKAERIVDLGGSCEGHAEGALVHYGYPYLFKSLTIVELPREKRHELYTEICGEYDQIVQTPQGPVNYVYSSMTDLSALADESTGLVYAGQSIEHVTTDEALVVLREVHRILKPGGHFCFDTPNRNVTRLGFPNYIVDDHKYEYTHQEMTAILEGNGFAVREAKGITLLDRSVREGRLDVEEAKGRDRLYADIENCFLLYYNAQKV